MFGKQASSLPGESLRELSGAADILHHQPAYIHMLHGHSLIYSASLVLGVALQQPIVIIDGAMRFNSYTLSAIARSLSLPPQQALRQAHVTRSFTAFQTEAAIREKLPDFLARFPCPLVIILGLLDTYYDEQVKPLECYRSLERVMYALRTIRQRRTHVLLVDVEVDNPPAGKEMLFRLVNSMADRSIAFNQTESGFHLTEEQRRVWDVTTIPSRYSSIRTKMSGQNSGAA